MSVLSSKSGLRVEVEPLIGRAVRLRILDAGRCDAPVPKHVTRIGARR